MCHCCYFDKIILGSVTNVPECNQGKIVYDVWKNVSKQCLKKECIRARKQCIKVQCIGANCIRCLKGVSEQKKLWIVAYDVERIYQSIKMRYLDNIFNRARSILRMMDLLCILLEQIKFFLKILKNYLIVALALNFFLDYSLLSIYALLIYYLSKFLPLFVIIKEINFILVDAPPECYSVWVHAYSEEQDW